MSEFDFDLFVIGGGSGGVRAARIAAGHGARVGLAEESRLGGTCVIRGCVPKKLYVFASQFAEAFEDARGYGWSVEVARFSWSGLVRAKETEITRLEGVYGRLLENAGVQVFSSRAELTGPHEVKVGERTVRAEKILVAVGGRPVRPDIPGAELGIVSDDAFDLEALPNRLLIIGGGYIAAEFAGIFNGLGVEVELAYRRDRILRGFDDDVRRVVEAGMEGRGIRFRYQVSPARVEQDGDGFEVSFSDNSRSRYDRVMFATGREPHTRGLGLEAAGVERGEDGRVPVDRFSRSNVKSVFAVGDVTDRIALTPVALMEGHALADTEFGGMERPVDHDNVPSAVFSQPALAVVGLTETEARARFESVKIFRSEFVPMKYTLSGRKENALMKLVVDAGTDRVAGLHVVGPDAAEIVQGFAVAMRAGLTKTDFDRTVGIHPTSAEELVTLRNPVSD